MTVLIRLELFHTSPSVLQLWGDDDLYVCLVYRRRFPRCLRQHTSLLWASQHSWLPAQSWVCPSHTPSSLWSWEPQRHTASHTSACSLLSPDTQYKCVCYHKDPLHGRRGLNRCCWGSQFIPNAFLMLFQPSINILNSFFIFKFWDDSLNLSFESEHVKRFILKSTFIIDLWTFLVTVS